MFVLNFFIGSPFVPKIAVGVDMFPHTFHKEMVVLFERVAEEESIVPAPIKVLMAENEDAIVMEKEKVPDILEVPVPESMEV